MVNWNSEDIKDFKKQARIQQQEYQDLLGDREWDLIEKNEITTLQRKVGFGMYGPPSSVPTSENLHTGYNKEQLESIVKICDQMVDGLNFENRNIHFACIFVVGKIFDQRFIVPVFKVKREGDKSCSYVDSSARKYSGWDDYLQNNKLPKCIYCYPTHGLYEYNSNNEVEVSFGTSPACDFVSRLFSVIDGVATVVTLGAVGVGVAALFAVPIAGPILAATSVAGVSTSVYGVSRSGYALVDRATHSESIGLDDAEARGYWLAIVGSSLGFAQGKMIQSMTTAARAGDVMSKAGRIAFFVIQTGSLTVNGIGIVHNLVNLIEKSEKKTLSTLDVFQFSASLLFFTNTVVNLKTASTIIKEVQHDVINSHRLQLDGDAKKLFNKHTGRLRGPDEMHGNANVVKQLNRIQNSKDLYETMVDKNIKHNKVKLTPEGYKGLLEVNKNLKIHPMKLMEIPPESRQAIFQATKTFANGSIDKTQFHKQMKPICKQYRIEFESMRKDTVNNLCKLYGKNAINEITVGGRKIFANATPHDIDRLRVVLENTTENNPEIVAMATEFAASKGCTTAKDFVHYTEYFAADLYDTVNNMEQKYQNDLSAAKKQPNFNEARFIKEYGIQGRRKQFFKEQALNEFRGGNKAKGYADLDKRFHTLKSEVDSLNAKYKPGFFSDKAATYHYLKHKNFGGNTVLTPEQYFKLAEEVVGKPTNARNAMLSQDGSCTMITYIEPQRGVRAIKIDIHGSAGNMSGIATVMYDSSVLQG